jgi:membrane protease YdiL (CAAX protease family)
MRTARAFTVLISRHPLVAFLVFVVMAAVLCESIWFGRFLPRVLYITAMAGSVLLTDLVAGRKQVLPDTVPDRQPALESTFALTSFLITVILLMSHFRWQWHYGSATSQVSWDVAMAFFRSSLPLLLFCVLVMKYRFQEVGFRLAGFRSAIYIMLWFAVIASVSHSWVWQEHQISPKLWLHLLMQELGSRSVIGFLWLLLFVAFSEEFLRMTFQSRLSAVLNNSAAGWFVTAVLWSLLHFPKFGSLRSCLEIVPEGLLWGYVMFRTRSLLPSVVLHGANFLWGFKILP